MADWVENITDKCIISKACRERFLPLDGDYALPLIQRGINFSGISDLRAPYEIARRRPGFHLVILTLGGEASFRLASMRGVLRPGDLWVVPAGEPQHYYTTGEWRIIFFHIAPFLPGGTIPFTGPAVIPATSPAQLESAMAWYLSELVLNAAQSPELAHSYAQVIRICLDRALESSRCPGRSRVRVRLDELREEISGNIGRTWAVSEMARRLSLSVSQCRRVVMAQYGCTPQDMLLRMRIGRAQQLLVRTEDTLSVVAERVGYESPFSLSRAFRRVVGMSPRQYRKQASSLASPAGVEDAANGLLETGNGAAGLRSKARSARRGRASRSKNGRGGGRRAP